MNWASSLDQHRRVTRPSESVTTGLSPGTQVQSVATSDTLAEHRVEAVRAPQKIHHRFQPGKTESDLTDDIAIVLPIAVTSIVHRARAVSSGQSDPGRGLELDDPRGNHLQHADLFSIFLS